ncbi:MAG: hypothetical protein AAB930_00205 [Patescibacteria group bacterium]
MTTQVLVEKLDKEVGELRMDINEMKRFLFQPLKDPEGEYRESFIRKMFKRSLSSRPFTRFADKESFLRHVRSKK